MDAVPAPATQTAQMQTGPSEVAALDKVMWFGIIQLVGMTLGWILGFYLFGTMSPSVAGFRVISPTPAEVGTALAPFFQMLGTLVPVIAVIELASLVVLTLAFRQLNRVDRGRFSTPTIFVLVLIAGTAVATVVFVPFINFIPSLIAQAPAGSGPALPPVFASALRMLLIYVALLGICGILALIGAVGGVILGLWRVGTRYDETLIKIGAIFSIIPLLNIAAPVLVLVGAHLARKRLA